MKTIWVLVPFLFTAAGCVTNGPLQAGPQADGGGSLSDAAASAPAAAPAFPPQHNPGETRLMQPLTGGAPVLGISLGGNMYQPVTGGPPVIGIPMGP